MPKKKLLIIDGNSLLHRAFYALPQLSTKEGIFTNGVYGFLTMFYKLKDEYKPNYIGVVFDRKAPTFRHIEFNEYKAGRKKTPNELAMQFPILKEILEILKVKIVELDGYEADDLAGTIAKKVEDKGYDVLLVTGDKDYLQLASENIKILITKKGISNIEEYDINKIEEIYGIRPEQFVDLKGLMGDKSDNIPGVPGIGEKTGLKLIKDYKTIENLYENIENMKKSKLKERLIENKNQAFMSKRLAKIVVNAPIEINIEDFIEKDIDNDELFNVFKKYEFNSILNKMDIKSYENSLDFDYELIKELDELEKLLTIIESKNKLFFKFIVDENDYLNGKVYGLAIKVDGSNSYYIDFEKIDITDLKIIFENQNIKKCGHNIKDDLLILFRHNVFIKGIYFDSLIGQYLLDPSRNNYSLKELSSEYLNIVIKDEEDLLGKGKNRLRLNQINFDDIIKIYVSNINVISKIEKIILEKLNEYDMLSLFKNVEMPLIEVLASMEYHGFKVNTEKLKELGNKFENKIENLTDKIYKLSGEEFNINSPKQLGHILFNKLNLPPIKKTKTGYSTNAEVLEKLIDKHEIIELILEYRHLVKLKSTYVDGLLNLVNKRTNRVHSSFNQTITTTGRISSTEPNLQNIPIKNEEGRELRKVFIAENENYKLIDADYSQIELRVMAHLSKDKNLMEAFFTDEDIHTKTASEVFGVKREEVTELMRSRAKAVNFGIIYGISDYGLSRDLKIERNEAKKYIQNYLKHYKNVKEYMELIVKYGKEKGYVTTILNRRRFLPELKSRNFNIRSFGERMAMNTPIQGSAADIIKVAMIRVYEEIKKNNLKSRLILQVHDELIVEAYNDEVEIVKQILKNNMEDAIKLSVPLKVDMNVGDSWYETK